MPQPSVVLISGCSSGIGRLTAETVTRARHLVYCTMRQTRTRNREAAQSLERCWLRPVPKRLLGYGAPDTQEVADAIARLIGTPAGQRPMRTVFGIDFGANALNEPIAEVQADVLRALGMDQMTAATAFEHLGKAAG